MRVCLGTFENPQQTVLKHQKTLDWLLVRDHISFHAHLAEHELLPKAASDICLYRNQNFSDIFIADFAIREAEFILWARSLGLEPKSLHEQQVIADARTFARVDTFSGHVIQDGLYVSRRHANGGGIALAYNRDNGRGYISRSHN
jgi:hypothetical protein